MSKNECKACHKILSTENALKVHIEIKHAKCKICHKVLTTENALKVHNEVKHSSKNNAIIIKSKENDSKETENLNNFGRIDVKKEPSTPQIIIKSEKDDFDVTENIFEKIDIKEEPL